MEEAPRMIHLENISKEYDGATVLSDINLYILKNEFLTLLGPSGCGKTTTLRLIGGFEYPTTGRVIYEGKDITDVPPYKRRVNTVFQKYALFPHLNVRDNIAFGLKIKKMSRGEIDRRVDKMLSLVNLAGYGKRSVDSLSGGQQQRIAIARALATNPRVLLCDEATSALDPKTTHAILELIRDINARLGITVIIITHQMSVIEEVCRHVAILDNGVVVEKGAVSEVFARPQSAAAKRLVFPDGVAQDAPHLAGGKTLRLVFNGADAAGEPLIARLAMELHIAASILAATTKNIGGRMFGNMLLSVPDEGDTVERTLAYLKGVPDMVAEEVEEHVS